RVYTIYKRKADKVRPVDWYVSDSSTLGGRPDWKEQRQMFEAILVAREPALFWDFSEIGRCSAEVQPPVRIRTIEH
ncbi:hypothetical protein M433DRAFT_536523, partial [Acidomyces richmondensis BFW]